MWSKRIILYEIKYLFSLECTFFWIWINISKKERKTNWKWPKIEVKFVLVRIYEWRIIYFDPKQVSQDFSNQLEEKILPILVLDFGWDKNCSDRSDWKITSYLDVVSLSKIEPNYQSPSFNRRSVYSLRECSFSVFGIVCYCIFIL